jgi:hypothetical protein
MALLLESNLLKDIFIATNSNLVRDFERYYSKPTMILLYL